ncbi:hypothetical protein EDC04DRAFT_2604515 [Pisolithus marmoratus]|nr:hypothetical protein EDC04DRAFT_2604515 [Pisolithus marmoratus]
MPLNPKVHLTVVLISKSTWKRKEVTRRLQGDPKMRMPSGGTKSDADGLRFQALKKPCGRCRSRDDNREYPHLCSIVAYLPLVYAAILSLELFRTRKSEKYPYLEQKPNWRQGLSSGLAGHSMTPTCNRPPTGSLRVTVVVPSSAVDVMLLTGGNEERESAHVTNSCTPRRSTVVPPVTASPAKKPGAATTTSAREAAPYSVRPNSTKTSPLPANSTKADNPAVVDDELAKHKARAERFGIPLVEPKQPPQRQAKKVSQMKQSGPVLDDPEKLKKRAERFGSTNTPTPTVKSGSKRAAPVEEVDAEELERRRKRAERLGTEYPVVY